MFGDQEFKIVESEEMAQWTKADVWCNACGWHGTKLGESTEIMEIGFKGLLLYEIHKA